MNISPEKLIEYKNMAFSFAIDVVPPFVLAIVVLWVWLKVIKWATKIIRAWLTKGHFDITIAKFVSNLINFALKWLLLITVAGMIWIETTSFVAIIWAAWLAVWLALQGSLANFAGGMLILLFKPYQIGDWIEIEWEMWKVEEIDILLTRMMTRDNKVVIIPNGEAANGKIINWTKKWPMRVEVPVWVWYNTDIDHARTILTEVAKNITGVKKSPSPDVVVSELWDSSVNLLVRAYWNAQDYPAIYSQILEEAKKALDKESIDIPFPHRVVHMINK